MGSEMCIRDSSFPNRAFTRISAAVMARVRTTVASMEEARAHRPRFVTGKQQDSAAVDRQASHLTISNETYSRSVDYTEGLT